jgi:hypothetical protein
MTSLYRSVKMMTSLIKVYCVTVWSTHDDCCKCFCYGPVKPSELVNGDSVTSMAM